MGVRVLINGIQHLRRLCSAVCSARLLPPPSWSDTAEGSDWVIGRLVYVTYANMHEWCIYSMVVSHVAGSHTKMCSTRAALFDG